MSQHDYNIANATFPNTRTDINNVLGAIATTNSGAAAPGTLFTGQIWLDTSATPYVLKMYDGTDHITLMTVNATTNVPGLNAAYAVGGTWTAAATWTLPALTLAGTVSGGGQQLNNIIIGTSTPLAGTFTTLGGTILTMSGTGYIGDTANANVTLGLTLNQDAADDSILALKSSDVAHGVTDVQETDTYGAFSKVSSTAGGMQVLGFSEITEGINLVGYSTTDDTTHTAGGRAAVVVRGRKKSGTGATAVGANGNVFSVDNNGSTCFIVDAEGDLFADGGSLSTTMVTLYDSHDDLMLCEAFDQHRAYDGQAINDEFAQWAMREVGEQYLVDLGILGAPFRDGGLVNVTRLQKLHNGAIRQLNRQNRKMSEELSMVKEKLFAIENRSNH